MNSLRLGVATWGVVSGSSFSGVCVLHSWTQKQILNGIRICSKVASLWIFDSSGPMFLLVRCSKIGAGVSQTPSNGAQSKA